MRLLVVSHSYLLANTRGKFHTLADRCTLALLVPSRWNFDLVNAVAEPESDAKIKLTSSTVFLAGLNIRYVYPPSTLSRVLAFKPTVVLVEEEPTSLALAQFSYFQRRIGFRLAFFTWENVFWSPRGTRRIERFNFNASAGAIAGSQGALEVLRSKGYSKDVCIIPQMGIDTNVFSPSENLLPESPFSIGYIGRIAEEKGLRTLFDALGQLDGNWTLRIIGRGPLQVELEHAAMKRGWKDRVEWIGAVRREELVGHLRKMHVVVLASKTTLHWKEQFGRVLIEAMACGVPVIGSNSGAIPQVVGDAGLIFPEGDAEALANRLELLQSRSLRQDLSARGLERARSQFADSKIASKLYEFLTTL